MSPRKEEEIALIRIALNAFHELEETPARPESDANQLRAIASWLDRIDDAILTPLHERDIQKDLLRIADRLDKLD